MQVQGALIQEQGVTFAVVVVKQYVIDNRSEASRLIAYFSRVFGGVPVVLMSQDNQGVPTYLGRPDISRFMANIPLHAIPWREYTIS